MMAHELDHQSGFVLACELPGEHTQTSAQPYFHCCSPNMTVNIDDLLKECGWNAAGIPKVETLKQIGLWNFLNEETKTKITKMNGQ
jgi:hypothetical protein